MNEIEALKLALKCAERCESIDGMYSWTDTITAIKEALAQPEREIDPSTTFDEVAKGLQVSRMAIAALDALTIEQRRSINEPLLKAQLFLKAAARVFKEALAQPEQIQPSVHPNTHQPEPEAAPVAKNEGGRITWMIDDWPQNCLLYTHPPAPTAQTKEPEQEPVAIEKIKDWIEYLKCRSDYGVHKNIPASMTAGDCWNLALDLEQFINTTPPQRTWVGLTEEDKQKAFDDTQEGGGFWEFADAIEAKLKEKNT